MQRCKGCRGLLVPWQMGPGTDRNNLDEDVTDEMSDIVYMTDVTDGESEQGILDVKISLGILEKYISTQQDLPIDRDRNLILPLKLPKDMDRNKLTTFFQFFKKNKKPIDIETFPYSNDQKHKYVYVNVDDEKEATQKDYTQFSSFIRAMDTQLLIKIYQLVGALHCDRLQKILMVFLREQKPKEIKLLLIHHDPNEVKEMERELKSVPTTAEMLLIGAKFVTLKILGPLYTRFLQKTCRSIKFTNLDRGFIDCWYPLICSLQSTNYERMQAELINWHLDSYLKARDKRLGNNEWKGLTQYFFWTNLETKVTSLVGEDIMKFLDTIRQNCLDIRSRELRKIFIKEEVIAEELSLSESLTKYVVSDDLEASNIWVSTDKSRNAHMAPLSDTTIQKWGLLLINKMTWS